MLLCLAAEQQFNCFYLGANLPAADLLDAAAKLKTEIVVLSLVKTPPDEETTEDLSAILAAVGVEKNSIWLGGSGARHWLVEQQNAPDNCEFICDLDAFHAKARQRRFG